MPTVPNYLDTEERVGLEPRFRRGLTAEADPDAFGAGQARALGRVAGGLQQLAATAGQAQDIDDTNAAKDRFVQLQNSQRDSLYGANGFLNLQGSAAVNANADLQKQLLQQQQDLAKGLTPGASKKYETAASALTQSNLSQASAHAGQQRKVWSTESTVSQITSFASDAYVGYRNPGEFTKNVAAGVNDLDHLAYTNRWSAGELEEAKLNYVSGTTKNVALGIIQNDPDAGDKFLADHGHLLLPNDRDDVRNTLDIELQNSDSKRQAGTILAAGRSFAQAGDNGGKGTVSGASKAADSKASKEASTFPAINANLGGSIGLNDLAEVRNFFISRFAPGNGLTPESVEGLAKKFAINFFAFVQDAPPEISDKLGITSGYRTPESQADIISQKGPKYGIDVAAWKRDVAALGPIMAGVKWKTRFQNSGMSKDVGAPGGSPHQWGLAVDLSYNNRNIDHAPQEIRNWAHATAPKYGMYFATWESWHMEPLPTVVHDTTTRPRYMPKGYGPNGPLSDKVPYSAPAAYDAASAASAAEGSQNAALAADKTPAPDSAPAASSDAGGPYNAPAAPGGAPASDSEPPIPANVPIPQSAPRGVSDPQVAPAASNDVSAPQEAPAPSGNAASSHRPPTTSGSPPASHGAPAADAGATATGHAPELRNAPVANGRGVTTGAGADDPMRAADRFYAPFSVNLGTIVASSNAVSARALMPSEDQINKGLADITDPRTRELTRQRVYAQMNARISAQQAETKSAKAQFWNSIDQGQTPDEVPMNIRQAAGMAAVSAGWDYLNITGGGREPSTDPRLLFNLRWILATKPDDFAGIDLNDYRNRLSRADLSSLTQEQTASSADERKQRERGQDLTSAWSQAESQLKSVGIIKPPRNMSDDDRIRVADFNNILADDVDRFRTDHPGKKLMPQDIQAMINHQLLRVVLFSPQPIGQQHP